MDKPKFKIEKGFLLATLPFAGYITAYAYEGGYLSFFGIPSFLIRLGLEEIIVATSVVVSGLSSLYLVLAILYPFRNLRNRSTKRFAFFNSMLLFLVFFPFIFIFSNDSLLDKLIISLFVFFFILLLQFGFPLLFYGGRSLEEKITKADKARDKIGQIEDYIFSRPQLLAIFTIILATLYISGLAYSAGVRDAARQQDYLLFSDRATYILIRTYIDKKIALEVDKESKYIENNMRLIFADDNLELNKEKIGPLKKEEKRTISALLFNFIRNTVDKVTGFLAGTFVNVMRVVSGK